jgi:hypothetical protein
VQVAAELVAAGHGQHGLVAAELGLVAAELVAAGHGQHGLVAAELVAAGHGQHGLVAAELAAPGLVAAADERFEQRTADAHAQKNARKKQQLVAEATILTAVADCCLCYAVLSRV